MKFSQLKKRLYEKLAESGKRMKNPTPRECPRGRSHPARLSSETLSVRGHPWARSARCPHLLLMVKSYEAHRRAVFHAFPWHFCTLPPQGVQGASLRPLRLAPYRDAQAYQIMRIWPPPWQLGKTNFPSVIR